MSLGANKYYVANNQQILPMYDTAKKTWSERFKITKSEKSLYPTSDISDCPLNPIQHSMRYAAEPWIYGTVRGIPARPVHHAPGLFGPLPAEVAVVVCSCPEYLSGTKRELKKASICKKCKGSRLPLAPIGGTVRVRPTSAPILHKSRGNIIGGTVRLQSINGGGGNIKSRPSILDPQNDPYDLMRRTRLLSPEPKTIQSNGTEKPGKSKTKNKSTNSPTRGRTRTRILPPSPSVEISTLTKDNSRSKSAKHTSRQDRWLDNLELDPGGRRSILHCDINPYDLISRTAGAKHNNEFAPDYDDDIFDGHDHIKSINSIKDTKRINYSKSLNIAGQRISLGESSLTHVISDSKGSEFVFDNIKTSTKNSSNSNNNNNNSKKDEIIRKVLEQKEQIKQIRINSEKESIEESVKPKRPPRHKKLEINSVANDSIESRSNGLLKIASNYNDTTTTTMTPSSPSSSLSSSLSSPTTPTTISSADHVASQKQGIKSILKRPSSVTSSLSSSSDSDAKYSSDSRNDFVTSNHQNNHHHHHNHHNHPNQHHHHYDKMFNENNAKGDIKRGDSSDSKMKSKFYQTLSQPPPTRKKVQFMVEDKIIHDEIEDDDEDVAIIEGGCVSEDKEKFIMRNGNGNLKSNYEDIVQKNQHKQQQILDVLQQQTIGTTSSEVREICEKDAMKSASKVVVKRVKVPSIMTSNAFSSSTSPALLSSPSSSSVTSSTKMLVNENNRNVSDGKNFVVLESLDKQKISSKENGKISLEYNDRNMSTETGPATTSTAKFSTTISPSSPPPPPVGCSSASTPPPRRAHSLRRAHSDRRSNTTTIILNFNDTMALRTKNTRAGCRDLFSNDVEETIPTNLTTTPTSTRTTMMGEEAEVVEGASQFIGIKPVKNEVVVVEEDEGEQDGYLGTSPVPTDNISNSSFLFSSNNSNGTNVLIAQVSENNGKIQAKGLGHQNHSIEEFSPFLEQNQIQQQQQEQQQQQQQNYQKPSSSVFGCQVNKKISWQEDGCVMIKNGIENYHSSVHERDKENSKIDSMLSSSSSSLSENYSVRIEPNSNVISFNNNKKDSKRQHDSRSSNNSTKSINKNLGKGRDKLVQAQNEINNGARIFGNNHYQTPTMKPTQKTVVRVAPFNKTSSSPNEIHRLKINHTDESHVDASSVSQRKTSILINGDDCYSTVNVSSDIPIYQSSVVVADGTTDHNHHMSKNSIVSKISSNTVTISVSNSSPRTPEEEIIYKNNKINTLLSLNCGSSNNTTNSPATDSSLPKATSKAIIPIRSENKEQNISDVNNGNNNTSNNSSPKKVNDSNKSTKRGRTLITLDFDKTQEVPENKTNNNVLSHEEELVKILRNPVEAVRRNLVPHVCGKNGSSTDDGNGNENISDTTTNITTTTTTTTTTIPATITIPNNNHQDESLKSQSFSELFQNSGKHERNSFIGKLLEDPTLGHLAEGLDSEVVIKLIENSLKRLKENRNNVDTSGTKDNDDMTKLIDISLQKVKEERLKLEASRKQESLSTSLSVSNSNGVRALATATEMTADPPTTPVTGRSLADEQESQSNRGSVSSGNSFSSANYELFDFDNNESDCYQSCSSEIAGDDDNTISSTRNKFYQMLVDATLSEIEISTSVDDDHHYESIRMGGVDPIYEEISDVPPPLPLSPPPLTDPELEKKNTRSMFEGASKYDILSYLVDARERGIVKEESYEYNFSNTSNVIVEEEGDTISDLTKAQNTSTSSDVVSSRMSHLSVTSDSSEDTSLTNTLNEKIPNHHRKLSSDIERNDSGVGSETSKSSRSKYQNPQNCLVNKNSLIHLCEDCDGPVETHQTDSGVMYAPLVCRKCGKKRAERKEIITEIVETEEKYGRDLQIILEEFCQPMLVAGLLTQEQLSAIFLNTEELLENNQTLAEKMRDALDIALEQGDDDLLQVNVGKIFLEATSMLHAFESYCVRQAAASLLLANLEKEKELLRIFLRVSQMENTVLRRMNLNSFLMVPVQRVTKYPLLLARLYKVTPPHLEGKELLKQAQEKIELHLNHMNQEAKDVPTKLWRRISSSSPNRRSSCEIDMINIKLRKMAIDVLEWNHDEVRFAMEGKLLFTQPTDSNWKKGRTIKLTPVNALLVTNGKPSTNYKAEKALSDQLNFPRHTGIREASLLLVKEKCGRYTLIREPLYLDRCVVCTEADWDDYFEVHEILSKDTFIFKAEDGVRTKQWYAQLQYHAQGMGAWRKRRNALANIMINGMLSRT